MWRDFDFVAEVIHFFFAGVAFGSGESDLGEAVLRAVSSAGEADVGGG